MTQKITKKPQTRFKRTKTFALTLTLLFGNAACTHMTQVNTDTYKSAGIFQQRVEALDVGMTKEQTLAILSASNLNSSNYNSTRKTMIAIEDKREKRLAVYGDGRAPLTLSEKEEERIYMNRLDVFKIPFKDLISKQTFAFSSIKDKERGYSMSVTLIFKDGVLLEDPKINGGFAQRNEKESIFRAISNTNVLDKVL